MASNMSYATFANACIAGLLTEELLSDDEDDDDDMEYSALALASVIREDRIKSQRYYEMTTFSYLPDEFKRFFKLNSSTVEELCRLLAGLPEFIGKRFQSGRPPIPLEKKVLMTLGYLASIDTIHDLSDMFNVTGFSLLRSKTQIVEAINAHLLGKLISWPKANDLPTVATNFDDAGAYRFPRIVGAVDGSHIPIEAPIQNANSYYNRKGFHSIILQAVCTDKLMFTDINVGWPGRVHDAKVLKHSSLWDSGFTKCQNGRYLILGDGAYPLKEWLLTPYIDNGHLTQAQARFNRALYSKRLVIERAFAHLKGRFRRLKYIHAHSVETVCRTVTASCILHNLCINEKDYSEDILDVDGDNGNVDHNHVMLIQQLQNDAQGQLKRLNITNTM